METKSMMFGLAQAEKESPQFNIPGKMKIAACKAADRIFAETGIEDVDIEPAIDRLGIRMDPDLRGIVQAVAIKTMQLQAQKVRGLVNKVGTEEQK